MGGIHDETLVLEGRAGQSWGEQRSRPISVASYFLMVSTFASHPSSCVQSPKPTVPVFSVSESKLLNIRRWNLPCAGRETDILMHDIEVENVDFVTVNFMCQLAWATRCPDMGQNLISGCISSVSGEFST